MGMATTKTTKCSECHRTLTAKASIARGRGPVCDLKARRRAAAERLARPFKNTDAAVTKALNLLADRALVPTRHTGQYLAVASDGTTSYLVDTIERSCTCKGFGRVGRCYHQLAAEVAEITTTHRAAYVLAA